MPEPLYRVADPYPNSSLGESSKDGKTPGFEKGLRSDNNQAANFRVHDGQVVQGVHSIVLLYMSVEEWWPWSRNEVKPIIYINKLRCAWSIT